MGIKLYNQLPDCVKLFNMDKSNAVVRKLIIKE